eukprot:1188686-Prorocentrum_minimum.AAC.4
MKRLLLRVPSSFKTDVELYPEGYRVDVKGTNDALTLFTRKQVELCSKKLERAEQLINGLGGEKVRWNEVAKNLGEVYTNLTGDILISAGVISYIGAFTMKYRDELVEGWVTECSDRHIPGSKKYSLNTALGNPVKVNMLSLPSRDWCPRRVYSLEAHAIGARYGYLHLGRHLLVGRCRAFYGSDARDP